VKGSLFHTGLHKLRNIDPVPCNCVHYQCTEDREDLPLNGLTETETLRGSADRHKRHCVVLKLLQSEA
jgi:hypothetical protein